MKRPLAIDLCCGLGGWTAGLMAEGWGVVGFDIVRPVTFPAQLVIQDVMTLTGHQFAGHAQLIVASPPCTEFSQCWNFAKHRVPDPVGAMVLVRHVFAICRDARCPFVVENVMGARKYFKPEFGAPSWCIGPFCFWGDMPTLRPYGRFAKGIWSTNRDSRGERRWHRDNRSKTYVRDKAERAKIPMEIARAVGREFLPRAVA